MLEAVGTDRHGEPRSDVIVVSDHVNLNGFLASKGFDLTRVRGITSGPAAQIYRPLICLARDRKS